jgi:hypothetical protein
MEQSIKKIFQEVKGGKRDSSNPIQTRLIQANFVRKHAINVPKPYMGLHGKNQEVLKTLLSKNPINPNYETPKQL